MYVHVCTGGLSPETGADCSGVTSKVVWGAVDEAGTPRCAGVGTVIMGQFADFEDEVVVRVG